MKVIDSAFVSAFLTQPQIVKGLRLLPFSLAHALYLQMFDCSFMTGGTLHEKDFAQFFLVCGHTYEEIRAMLATYGATTEEMLKINETLSVFDEKELCNIIKLHIDNFLKNPLKRIEQDQKKKFRLPVPLFYAAFLMSEMNMTETQAWNCPWSLASSYYAAWESLNGESNLLDEETLKQQQERFHL
jgi:hypothetical protein